MESRDTVMSREQLDVFWLNPEDCDDEYLAEAQAEITWPIARKVGYDEALGQLAEMTVEIRGDILKQLRDFNQRGLTITEAIELLQ